MKPIFRRGITVFIAMIMAASAMSAGAIDETQETAAEQTSSMQKDESVEMLDVSSVEQAENPDPQIPSQEEGQEPQKPYVHNAEGLAEFKRLTQERLDIISELSAVRDTKQELENAENSEQVQKQVVRAMQAKQPDLDTADFESKEAVSNELDVQERKLLDDLKAKENQLEGIGAVPSDEILEQLPAGPAETNENGMLRTAPTQSLKDLEERLGTYYKVYGCESLVTAIDNKSYICYTISAQDSEVSPNKVDALSTSTKNWEDVYNAYVDETKYQRLLETSVRLVASQGLGKVPYVGWLLSGIEGLLPRIVDKQGRYSNVQYQVKAQANTSQYFVYVKNAKGKYKLCATANTAVVDVYHFSLERYTNSYGHVATRKGESPEYHYNLAGEVHEIEFEAVDRFAMYKDQDIIPAYRGGITQLCVSPEKMEEGWKQVYLPIKSANSPTDLDVWANQ